MELIRLELDIKDGKLPAPAFRMPKIAATSATPLFIITATSGVSSRPSSTGETDIAYASSVPN